MGSDQLFHRNKIRKAKDIARHAAKKSAYETVLIVCEGEKSEVNYFEGLRKKYRLNTANIVVMPSKKGSAPINVVEFAIEIGDNKSGIDKVYCVFDRDEHKSYQQALDKINNHKPKRKAKNKPKYQGIVSSPCFELWLLLHFTYTTKAFSRTGNKSAGENLIGELRRYLPGYVKNSKDLFNALDEYTEIAIKNAIKLKIESEKTGFTDTVTDIHRLVEYLINLKIQDN